MRRRTAPLREAGQGDTILFRLGASRPRGRRVVFFRKRATEGLFHRFQNSVGHGGGVIESLFFH